jgi:mannose-1-phosphate guanylyltransferase
MKKLYNIVKKPWGEFCDFAESSGKWHLKTITIKKGHRLSLQQHLKRSELWIVAAGKVLAQKGKKNYILTPPKSIFIKKKEMHRIEALMNSVVIEITFGVHNEKDIIRFADDYNRK